MELSLYGSARRPKNQYISFIMVNIWPKKTPDTTASGVTEK